MKKFLFLLTLLCAFGVSTASAQDDGWASNPGGGQHYTVGDLDAMGKLDLTQIYIQEVHRLNMLLPYVPFNKNGEAISLAGLGIPDTKDNNGAVKKVDGSTGSHNEALESTMAFIVPYADKKDIIEAILFVQDIIEKIEVGL